MKKVNLVIAGMHCNHCIQAVRRELSKLQGVVVEDVQLGIAQVEYDESSVSTEDLRQAIEDSGYKLSAR